RSYLANTRPTRPGPAKKTHLEGGFQVLREKDVVGTVRVGQLCPLPELLEPVNTTESNVRGRPSTRIPISGGGRFSGNNRRTKIGRRSRDRVGVLFDGAGCAAQAPQRRVPLHRQ